MREPGDDDDVVPLGEVLGWPLDDHGNFIEPQTFADLIALGLVAIPKYEPAPSSPFHPADAELLYIEAALARYQEQRRRSLDDNAELRRRWRESVDDLIELRQMGLATSEDEWEMETLAAAVTEVERRERMIDDAIALLLITQDQLLADTGERTDAST